MEPPVVGRLLSLGFGLAIAAVVFQTAAHMSYALVFDYERAELNLDAENNTFSWLSSSATFAAAVAALLLAVLSARSLRWYALAAALALFSLDDAIQLHEKWGERSTEALGLPLDVAFAIWPIVFLPALAFVFVLLALAARSATGRIRIALGASLALLVLAIGTEALQAAWYSSGQEGESFGGALLITIEEDVEIAGWILIATALLAMACEQLLARPD